MRNRKISLLSVLITISLMICFSTGCAGKAADVQTETKSDAGKTRTVTDSLGNQVQIPEKIKRIADAWGAHNEVVAAVGAGNEIVATTLTQDVRPWLYKVAPNLKNANTSFSVDASEINFEELIKTKPDVLFMNANEQNAKKAHDVGIPVVQLKITDFNSLEKCVSLTGEVLGDEAKKNADKYNAYLEEKMKMISGRTAKIPKEQKPKVLHIASLSPLTIDGKDALPCLGIEVAGGINVADISGNSKTVSMEQILQWNPDVIILGRILSGNGLNNTAQISNTDADAILKDPDWQKIKAVRDKKVYSNPDGAFTWDRYSAEEALQIQWLAKLFNPDLFQDIDMVKETRYFFKTFMNYDLSEDEANRMLAGQPPAH